MKRFENRTVIVTGAARGANHARRFAAEGANVIVAAHGEDGRELADE
jgi:NAD(P)-dependent dehydrogenase (short-subunit alcohol dehydrogenase family)